MLPSRVIATLAGAALALASIPGTAWAQETDVPTVDDDEPVELEPDPSPRPRPYTDDLDQDLEIEIEPDAAAAAPTAADDDEDEDELVRDHEQWHLSLDIQTEAPVAITLGLSLEMPAGIRIKTGVGIVPSPYVELINVISTEAGWYDAATATLISATIDNSFIWRTHLGWRPFAEYGFYFGAGYSLVALGGGLTGPEIVAAVVADPPQGTGQGQSALEIDATAMLHMLDLEIGYEWLITEIWTLRVGLGGTFTVAGSSELTVDTAGASQPQWAGPLTSKGEAYLDDVFTSYVHTLTLNLAFGYRFL